MVRFETFPQRPHALFLSGWIGLLEECLGRTLNPGASHTRPHHDAKGSIN